VSQSENTNGSDLKATNKGPISCKCEHIKSAIYDCKLPTEVIGSSSAHSMKEPITSQKNNAKSTWQLQNANGKVTSNGNPIEACHFQDTVDSEKRLRKL
jgi:ribose 5-phosphate isomerase